ncbi:hypothetical protein BKA70DRAFT_1184850 [Coprinopsis sp. MPI-PUGE-AT-0042]|nr:hypothetical protein BKA70DRAFT_1184850 [Coprinopsis sp. MPI-PUGE-AT-0042]
MPEDLQIETTAASTSIGNNIVVNGFMFCADHGDEYCFACCCDHRLTNNIRIEDELQKDPHFDFEFDLEERQSINAYALGAEAAIQTEESFQCEKHRQIDCTTCFNWVEIVKKQEQTVEAYGRWNLGSAHKDGTVLSDALDKLLVGKS